MSVITDIADAVTTSLNAGTFIEDFTAERLHQPSFELPELQTLRVSVVPKSVEIRNATRQHSFFDCAVDVGIQQKIDDDDRVDERQPRQHQQGASNKSGRIGREWGALFIAWLGEGKTLTE